MLNDFEKPGNTDVSACNIDKLADLRDVKINRRMPLELRVDDFVSQAVNPYLFRVNDVIVKLEFCGEKDFAEIFANAIVTG